MKLILSTNPPISITISPGQLRAALPDDYDLVDLKDPARGGEGRVKRGKRGDIDFSRQLVPGKELGPSVELRDFLAKVVFPKFLGPFTATSCLMHLKQENLLAGEVVRNPIVMGRTLAAMIRDEYPGLTDIHLKGQRHYKYDAPDS